MMTLAKIRLFCLEGIAASFDQQHCQVECRSLVAVNEAMIRDNPVNQRGGLFMDAAVITIVRDGQAQTKLHDHSECRVGHHRSQMHQDGNLTHHPM